MSAQAKALAPDLTAALKPQAEGVPRARARGPATAKTQGWAPEERCFAHSSKPRSRRGDESNLRNRLRAAGFRVVKGFDVFKVAQSSVPQATFDYICSLEWVAPERTSV